MSEKPVLYCAPHTRSATAMFMDEELGRVCDIKLLNLEEGEAQKPAFLEINPMAKVPTLVYRGVTVTEAAAICAFLADLHPEKALAPASKDPMRGAYYRWLFFAPSVIEPMMLDKLGGIERENAAAAGHGNYARVMKSIDQAFASGPWLLGETFSAADVVMGSTLNFAIMFSTIPNEGPIKDYVQRIRERPAFQAMQTANAEAARAMGT